MKKSPLTIERDIAVPMRDGLRLFANVFRPTAEAPHPVIISVTPYGKDKLPDRLQAFFMRLSGVKFGKINCSRLTGFELPDPVYCSAGPALDSREATVDSGRIHWRCK